MRIAHLQIRTLMVVVAVVGIVFGAWLEATRLARISAARRREAASFGASEALGRKLAQQRVQSAKALVLAANTADHRHSAFIDGMKRDASRAEEQAAEFQHNADYWGMMRKKYEDAARQPWRPVSPDPSPPR